MLLNKQTRQDWGDGPLAVRESDKYREDYVHAFVDKRDGLIDWDGRARAEGDFFIEKLREHGARKVPGRRHRHRLSLSPAHRGRVRGHQRGWKSRHAGQGV